MSNAPGEGQALLTGRQKRSGWLVFAVVLALLLIIWLINRTVDWLWLGELGYRQVFWRILGTQLALFTSAFALLALYFIANARAALRSAAERYAVTGFGFAEELSRIGRSALIRWQAPILLAIFVAILFAGHWDDTLRFIFGERFGDAEPVLDRDVGFYLFTLPLIDAVIGWVLFVSFATAAAQTALHYFLGFFDDWRSLDDRSRQRTIAVLVWNLLPVTVSWGADYVLERYELLYASGGTVAGAGYTDVTFVMPALWGMAGVSAGVVAALFVALWRGRVFYIIAGVSAAVVAHVVALWIVPFVAQTTIVDPNELARERPYLEHNIAFTRAAFGIDGVEDRNYSGGQDLRWSDLEDNRTTIRDIRLWDYRPLLRTFRQIQQIRLYYQFYDVDVDRYRLADGYRQVMLSGRELTPELPERADTWVNRHLQYTHGYGLAMSLTAQEGSQGSPTLIVKDLPPVSEGGPDIVNPAIYFGEHMPDYRIVPSGIREFDYPAGDENIYVNYQGDGGVPVGSFWSRLLFATHLFDIKILLTEYINEDSRIQIRRPLKERAGRIAPFLELDSDPYLAASDGRLYWIQDAYTTSDRYPYSEPYTETETDAALGITRAIGAPFNYIRNSVKIVMDAYDGNMSFYVMDPEDPVLAAYRKAFPDLFQPLSALSEGLKAHLRYPLDLFEAQVARYAAYHMTDPQVFYNNEDLWAVPREKYGGSSITMQPYYVLMRLPEEESVQFILMLPLTPQGRDNMAAWMAARSDFPSYGELVAFKLPKERLIFGPMQVEALIDQDTAISRQLSLWDQRGSRVIRGNLLTIPIDHSLLYVEPVYLVAEESDLPQLKRVIVAYRDRVAMEPTLHQALATLFGRGPSGPAEGGVTGATGPPAVISTIRDRLGRAEDALSRGNWAEFGTAMEELRNALPPAETEAEKPADERGDAEAGDTASP